MAVAEEIKLRPQQRIRLTCLSNPSLTCVRTVAANGTVAVPSVGWVVVAGMGLKDAAHLCEEQVRFKTGQPSSFNIHLIAEDVQPIFVVGPLGYSGTYPFRKGLLVQEVVINCTPLPLADTSIVEVWDVLNKRRVIDIGDDPYELRPGDRVIVPRAKTPNQVFVVGGVMKPGAYAFTRHMKVKDALAAAGGYHPHGDIARMSIEHDGIGEATTLDRDLKRGDIIRIPLVDNPRYITVSGAVLKPGSYPYRENMPLTELLPFLEFAPNADLNNIWIQPLKGRGTRANLNRIKTGQEVSPSLPPGAAVTIGAVK